MTVALSWVVSSPRALDDHRSVPRRPAKQPRHVRADGITEGFSAFCGLMTWKPALSWADVGVGLE